MAYYKCGKIFATQNSNISIETASGAIANFNTSLAMPVLGCIAEFSATQDLHGQSAPYPAGGGKNLWGYGNQEVKSTYVAIELDKPLPVGNYAISAKISSTYTTVQARFRKQDASALVNASLSPSAPNRSSATVELTEPTYYIYLYSAAGQTGYEATWEDIQLEVGNQATSYAPYSNICPIVGVDKVNFARTGKNLFDKSKMVINTQRFVKYGVDAYNDTLPNGEFTLKANQAYTFTFSGENSKNFESFSVYNAEGTRVAITYNNKKSTFTPASTGAYYLAFAVSSANWGGTWDNYDIQLEFGSTATAYEPYNGTTAIINLGGTYYGGSVDAVTGKIPLTHGVYTFDGTEAWGLVHNTSPQTFDYFRLYGSPFTNKISNFSTSHQSTLLTSYPITDSLNYWYSGGLNGDINAWTVKNNAGLCIRNDSYSDANTFANSLSGQSLVYELATPIVVYASNTAEIPTILGDNNIFSDAGDVEVKYRKLNSDN